MNHHSQFADRVRKAFQPAESGVIGLVDNVLELSRVQRLRFDFDDSHCSVRPFGADSRNSIDVPLRKSVFRAMLAHIAALCNERVPNSVTPYHGTGELLLGTNPAAIFHVAFTNTPAEQRLDVSHLADVGLDSKKFAVSTGSPGIG